MSSNLKERKAKQEANARKSKERQKAFDAKELRMKKEYEFDIALQSTHGRVKQEKRQKRQKKLSGEELSGYACIDSYSKYYFRSPEGYKSKRFDLNNQVLDFLRYVFCEYHVPGFMFQCWFGKEEGEVIEHKQWFLAIARGHSLYKNYLKGVLTKAAIHDFVCNSKPEYSIAHNVWRAKMKCMGASDKIIASFVCTDKVRNMCHNEFWDGVILFYARNPMGDNEFNETFDYIRNRRDNDPDFFMKGRTLQSVIDLSNEWHREVIYCKVNKGDDFWLPCGIEDYEAKERVHVSKDVHYTRTWHIREIISSKRLREEGKAMHHCVGSYVSMCKSGSAAIFSMSSATKIESEKRVLTIEINPKSKTVLQSRGKFNAAPDENAKRILNKWMSDNGLTKMVGYW